MSELENRRRLIQQSWNYNYPPSTKREAFTSSGPNNYKLRMSLIRKPTPLTLFIATILRYINYADQSKSSSLFVLFQITFTVISL
jgi:hypothetical protein